VKELSDQAVAAPPRLNLAEWRAGFDELFARIAWHPVGGRGMLPGRQERDRPGPLPVRRYDAWYRHATLSMLALAFLQVCAAQRGHQRLWTTFPDTPAA